MRALVLALSLLVAVEVAWAASVAAAIVRAWWIFGASGVGD